ncbi:hypothetical protein D3C81_1510080 [compost metagenome]
MLKVLSSNKDINVDAAPQCTVKAGDTIAKYDEFAAFGYNELTGDIEFVFNADALTLLKSLVILQEAATTAFNMLEPDLRDEVRELIWGASIDENNT